MSAIQDSKHKAERKALQVEVNNPNESTQWKVLWDFDEDEWVNTQSLIDDLNIINAPVQLRIVPKSSSIISVQG